MTRLNQPSILATVADVTFVGPNFEIARRAASDEENFCYLKALIEVSGINQLNGYAFGWQIGPRINAAENR